jgi:Tetraspanin family
MIQGALSLLKIGEFSSYLQNPHLEDATIVPTIVICLGVFIFIISFIGSCGSLQEKRILLETYSICLLVLVLFQVVLSVLIFLFLDDINKDSMRSFNKIWRSRGFSDNRIMIEMIQENLECCGSANMYDYNFEILPLSCCPKTMERCSFDEAFQLGCKPHLADSIHTSGITISYLCLITAAFEVRSELIYLTLFKEL